MSRIVKLTAATAAAGAVLAGIAAASPASAAPLPSNCTSTTYRICMYYNGNGGGAYYHPTNAESIPDFGTTLFPNNGAGGGTRVKNNAASAANTVNTGAYVFYNEHCSGPYDAVPAKSLVNLVNTWNDNASYENPYLNDQTLGSC